MQLPPSASTKSMSPDRGCVGKIVGHLYLAAKTLLEGHPGSMEEVRHEIRRIMNGHFGEIDSDSADGDSVLAWNKLLTRLIQATRKLPDTSGSLPDRFKQELAHAIRQGKKLCSGNSPASDDARAQVTKARQLYLNLSGASYL